MSPPLPSEALQLAGRLQADGSTSEIASRLTIALNSQVAETVKTILPLMQSCLTAATSAEQQRVADGLERVAGQLERVEKQMARMHTDSQQALERSSTIAQLQWAIANPDVRGFAHWTETPPPVAGSDDWEKRIPGGVTMGTASYLFVQQVLFASMRGSGLIIPHE
jgi:hypothetical protein